MATEVQIPNPTGTIQRPLRGSRISTFYPVKSLPALSSLDSAFQLQEYISLLIRLDVHDVEAITTLPGKSKDAKEKEAVSGEKETKTEEEGKDGAGGEEKDVTVDEACWIYEQLRRLAQDLTHPLITTLQQECSRATCPEMKAGEWLYLCVAHGTEGAMEQCCAIDYILHTLDSATALLNSPRTFPSRLQIPTSSHRHFPSLARRLGRIFAHAYFHHREAFEQAEAESSLYARFLTLTSKFDLVPSEFLMIPPSAGASHGSGSGDSDEEDGGSGGEGGFGLREVKLGTSYDPRRSSQTHSMTSSQHQLPSSFQDEFPDVPRARRLPQQYAQHQQYSSHPQPHQQQLQQELPMNSGTESPRKMGRNRTHTMILSEAANAVDDLAKATAAARAEEEKEREREREEREKEEEEEKEREEREREAKAREEAEKEQRDKTEAEAIAKQDSVDSQSHAEGGEEEENAVDDIAKGEAEAEEANSSFTRKEDESAVVALLVDQQPEKSETGESTTTTTATTDENDATTTPATTQEVDIVESATNTTDTKTADTTTDNDASPETKEDTGSVENHSKPEEVGEADVAVGSEEKEKDEAKTEAAEVTEKGGDAEEEGKNKET